MPKIKMYCGSYCPFCIMAKKLLKAKNLPYEEINLDGRHEERMKLQEETGFRTIPQIFIGEKFIGGYQELAYLNNTGELDQMLNES